MAKHDENYIPEYVQEELDKQHARATSSGKIAAREAEAARVKAERDAANRELEARLAGQRM